MAAQKARRAPLLSTIGKTPRIACDRGAWRYSLHCSQAPGSQGVGVQMPLLPLDVVAVWKDREGVPTNTPKLGIPH
jgi:hypothetical protein